MSAARGQMVSLTDWLHERQARAWWRSVDLGELVTARRPIPRAARGNTAPQVDSAPKKAHAGPCQVDLSPFARSALLSQIEETGGWLETGGALIGHLGKDGQTVVIEDATGPGRDAEQTHDSIVLDLASSAFPLEDAYWSNGWNGRICGSWQTHPSGSGKPSDIDREHFRGNAELLGVWVGLIVTEGPDPDWPWLDPELHGYVTSRGNLLCRRVQIVNVGYAWE